MGGNIISRKSLAVGVVALLLFTSIPIVNNALPIEKMPFNNDKDAGKSPSASKVIVVPDDYPTIQEAIDHANVGDTIKVRAGIYHENINVYKMLNIIGSGSSVTIIDGGGKGNVVEITADGIKFTDFTVRNSGSSHAGIYVSSHYNIISRNNIVDNAFGLKLDSSSGNQIHDNVIENNKDKGVWLYRSHANNITGNTVMDNKADGVLLNFSCIGNTFFANDISSNGADGISISETSRSNTFVGNLVAENKNKGVNVVGASDSNIFYYNDFVDNVQNSFDTCVNMWDNGSVGNYWSDYTGVDANNDGIGDTPYSIPGGDNQDRYPLMSSVRPSRPNIEIIGPDDVYVGWSVTFTVWTPECTNKTVIYRVYWGDGTAPEEVGPVVCSEKVNIRHSYGNPGTYNVYVKACVDVMGVLFCSVPSEKVSVRVISYGKGWLFLPKINLTAVSDGNGLGYEAYVTGFGICRPGVIIYVECDVFYGDNHSKKWDSYVCEDGWLFFIIWWPSRKFGENFFDGAKECYFNATLYVKGEERDRASLHLSSQGGLKI